jgi:large subunit ribosomal protein L17
VLKLGPNRPGDAAEMALIGLVEDEIVEKAVKPSQKKAEVKPIDMVEGAAKTAE